MTAIDELLLRQRESTRRDACWPLDRHDPGQHRLFCYPERRGVEYTAGVAPARDEHQQRRGRRGTAAPARRRRSRPGPRPRRRRDGRPRPVLRRGEAAASVAATSCLLRLSAAPLSKRSSRHGSTTGLGGAAISPSDAALLLPPMSGHRSASTRTIACSPERRRAHDRVGDDPISGTGRPGRQGRRGDCSHGPLDQSRDWRRAGRSARRARDVLCRDCGTQVGQRRRCETLLPTLMKRKPPRADQD
jgi:hypothetical protein